MKKFIVMITVVCRDSKHVIEYVHTEDFVINATTKKAATKLLDSYITLSYPGGKNCNITTQLKLEKEFAELVIDNGRFIKQLQSVG